MYKQQRLNVKVTARSLQEMNMSKMSI